MTLHDIGVFIVGVLIGIVCHQIARHIFGYRKCLFRGSEMTEYDRDLILARERQKDS